MKAVFIKLIVVDKADSNWFQPWRLILTYTYSLRL